MTNALFSQWPICCTFRAFRRALSRAHKFGRADSPRFCSFIPLGLMLGAEFGTGYYIWKSMIPAFLGNAVGAALLAVPLTSVLLTSNSSGSFNSFLLISRLFFLMGPNSSSAIGGLPERIDEEARVDSSAGSSVLGLNKD